MERVKKHRVVKVLGILLSALWLLATGYIAYLLFIFARMDSLAGTSSSGLQDQFIAILGYIACGLWPVVLFTYRMKRRGEPIGIQGLTVLALFAVSPILVYLAVVLARPY